MKHVKKKIYLAGRISKHDWRDDGGRSEFMNGDGQDALLIEHGFPDRTCSFGSFSFTRTGPYFVGCDHGCGHGPGEHGLGITAECIEGSSGHDGSTADRRRSTVERCLAAIQRADVVFAWLEPGAYGTVTEIGYAAALGKTIFCARPTSVDADDLWFAGAMSGGRVESFENPAQAMTGVLSCLWNIQRVREVLESPIEAQFLQALRKTGCRFRDVDDVVVGLASDFRVYPQFQAGPYRLDFAFISDTKRVAVELDGHNFHERTKEQAQRDKKRDRDLQAEGWAVLRFTGSEVHADAAKCVRETLAIVAG